MPDSLPAFLTNVNPDAQQKVTPVNHPEVEANRHPVQEEQPLTGGITNPWFTPEAPAQQPQQPTQSYQLPVAETVADTRPPVVQVQPLPTSETSSVRFLNPNTPTVSVTQPTFIRQEAVNQAPISNPLPPAEVRVASGPVAMPSTEAIPPPTPTPIKQAIENQAAIQNPQASDTLKKFEPQRMLDLTASLAKLKEEGERDLAEIERQQAILAEQRKQQLGIEQRRTLQEDQAQTQHSSEEAVQPVAPQPVRVEVPKPPPPPIQPEMTAPAQTLPLKDSLKKLGEVQATQSALHKDMDTTAVPFIKKQETPDNEELLKPGEENEADLEMRHAKFEELYKQLKDTDISSLSEFSQTRVNRILEKFRGKIDAARKATTEVEAIARIASGVRLILRAQRAVEALDALVNTRDEKNPQVGESAPSDAKPTVNGSEQNTVESQEEPVEVNDDNQTNAPAEDSGNKEAAETNDGPLTADKVAELLAPLSKNDTGGENGASNQSENGAQESNSENPTNNVVQFPSAENAQSEEKQAA